MYSLSEVESRLLEVMDEAGLSPAPGQSLEISDNKFIRYQLAGDKRGKKNGAYLLHLDERPAGYIQNWKTKESVTFTMKGMPPLSAEETERFRQQIEANRVKSAEETARKQAEAARRAKMMWKAASAASPDYPYLKKKKVPSYTLKHGPDEAKTQPDGTVKGGNTDVLYVPLYDGETKKLINLQQIYPNGGKYPLSGGRMQGVFSPIGNNPDGPILVCEGWATGASLYKLTGYTVVCAMNAGNLPDVARMVKLSKQEREVLVCADNDHETEARTGKNPGKSAAVKAAELAHLGAPIWPDFTETEDGTDWNDYMVLHGEEAARAHFRKKYDEAHVMMESVPSGPMNTALFPDINARNGKPLGTIENVEALLRYYKIQVRYNEVTKDQEIYIPGCGGRTDNLQEANNNRIISLAAKHEIPTTRVSSFVDVIAENNRYNPVRDWIQSRSWDGIPRLTKFIETIQPRDGFDTHTSDMMARLWMIAAVAAVFKAPCEGEDPFSTPGVLVLQGEQGCGKTTWFRNLAPRGSGWVGEGRSIDPSRKDSLMGALRFWITELGELESTLKRDMPAVKAFITDTQDVIRIPYSKKHSVFPRRTVFGASVNQAEFLSDITGNRRWWCIPVKSIDNAHNLDIQQIWAEVYSMYEDGATWYPDDHQTEIIRKASWQFTFPDPIMDLVLDKFDWEGYPHRYTKGYTATEVLKLCGMDRPTPADVRTCGTILRRLTGKEPHRGTGGQRLYYLPDTTYYGSGS